MLVNEKVEQAKKTAEVMRVRAGYDCDIVIIEDKDRVGYTSTINTTFKANSDKYNLFVYTAQDVFVGKNWLANAMIEQFKKQSGLVSFNDGKWDGALASFGLVDVGWAKQNYNGNLFFPGYQSHYGDTELTQLAKQQKTYRYAEKAVMMEVDYEKATSTGKGVVKKDKKLYKKRKKSKFDGLITDKELIDQFS